MALSSHFKLEQTFVFFAFYFFDMPDKASALSESCLIYYCLYILHKLYLKHNSSFLLDFAVIMPVVMLANRQSSLIHLNH